MFCKNCGKEISDNAPACPSCGEPNLTITGKSKTVAILLCLFLGGVGAHRFYLGRTGSAIGMIVCLLLIFVTPIWALIDLVRIITGSLKPIDGEYSN